MKKKILSVLATVFIFSGSYVVFASQNSSESSLTPIRVTNISRGEKLSDYQYVKTIPAQSRMGTVEKYDLYKDVNGNYCVKKKRGQGYAYLEIYNKEGWSHTFTDGTTYWCNIY